MDQMSVKERWLAAVKLEPVDRLPFWPKWPVWYAAAQEEPFRSMSLTQLDEWIGSDIFLPLSPCVKEIRKSTSIEVKTEPGVRRVVEYATPGRTLTKVDSIDPTAKTWAPDQLPIKTIEDVEAMTEWYNDCEYEIDRDELAKVRDFVNELGQKALTRCTIGKTGLLHMINLLAGLENTHMLLVDCPDKVEALFEGVHQNLKRKLQAVLEDHPADVFFFSENTSTTTISPRQFKDYCYDYLAEYGQMAHDAGKIQMLHMCGHLKDLLPILAGLPADAFEAFTSPPVGNTTFLDGRSACPEKCLIGGTNATLWLEPAESIIAEIEERLSELPHCRGLAVSSGGAMPPGAKPEAIKQVFDWLKGFRVD